MPYLLFFIFFVFDKQVIGIFYMGNIYLLILSPDYGDFNECKVSFLLIIAYSLAFCFMDQSSSFFKNFFLSITLNIFFLVFM